MLATVKSDYWSVPKVYRPSLSLSLLLSDPISFLFRSSPSNFPSQKEVILVFFVLTQVIH